MVKNTMKLGMLVLAGSISACSTVKDMTNVDLWPFGKGGDQGHEYQPANSTPYVCEGNKKFFVRYLDKGASVWLILPDREVALAQVGSSKVYSNGISKLDLSGSDVSLEVNETTKYVGCKSNSVAAVSKVENKPVSSAQTESKPEAKPALKAEAKSETSEKGWFDRLKFWESDEKPKQAEAAIKPVEKAPEPAPVVVAKEEPVAKVVEVAKPAEPAKVEPALEPVAAVAKEEKAEVAVEEVAPQGDVQAAVAKAVETWANAWRTKNADAYLNAYATKFKPEGMSKATWVQQRKQRVGANPAEITLSLDKLNIVADAKKATATFAQHYASGKYSDDVVKVLSFENVNGQWLIVKESAKAASAK
ncbi:MAG: hypothetical protein RLZZ98_1133 [Pseudomonadota bacterium]